MLIGAVAGTAVFQSTSPVRGTTTPVLAQGQDFQISIHVPREGDDFFVLFVHGVAVVISIHVPREGDDLAVLLQHLAHPISIHVPREGDDPPLSAGPIQRWISIHVPREGDDFSRQCCRF